MTTPTAAELALLRSQPHESELYLSIYRPKTVFAAQVNDAAIEKGEQVITYNNVTTGQWQDIHVGMTLHVGSTPGGKDKGSIYVFTRDSSTITVGENSHINWEDNDYLSVVDFYQIWPIYPRYVQTNGDVDVYKAYSVSYTDENEVLGSLICMGSHFAGFLDPNSGEIDVYYSASGTENMLGHAISYSWEFEGGTPTGSTAHTPGYVTYDTPGHYVTRLNITTAEGESNVAVRHISIYDRPGEGSTFPVMQWGMENLAGSRGEGGYTVRCWAKGQVDDIEDGALVVIFSDDWYGDTQQSIGGNSENRESIFFVGYILDGTIEYDYRQGVTYFTVGSPSEIMKLGEAFSVSVESSTDPVADSNDPDKGGDPWFYLVDLSVKRAIYHYLRWHTTVNVCCDIQYLGPDWNIQYFDANRTSIYEAIRNLMEGTIRGSWVSDRQGKMWAQRNVDAIDQVASNLPFNMFVDKQDWAETPEITERMTGVVSYIEMGGVAYSGPSSGTSTALLSSAPGNAPAYRGSHQKLSGFALTGQSQLNTLAGNIWAFANSRYPEVMLPLTGNYRNFDIAPLEYIRLTVSPEDTPRNVDWEQKPFAVEAMEWEYEPGLGVLLSNLYVAEITQGFAASTIAIEDVPPPEEGDTPIPPPPPPPVPPPLVTGRYISMNFIIDGGGAAISTGIKGDLKVAFSGRIDVASLYSDQDGDIEVDIWVDSHANFPPTVADSIVASAPLTLSAEDSSLDATLTGWTRSFVAGSIFRFNVNSASSVTRVLVHLKIWRD